VLLLCAFVAVIFNVVNASFRHSTVYQQALVRAGQSPEVARLVGEPLEPGRVLQGQLNVSGSTGSANMRIPITGPHGKATIVLDARKVGGTWAFRTLEVQFEGRSDVVNLLEVAPAAEK
jgi:Cytochrome oxidase complex assembly protein 1